MKCALAASTLAFWAFALCAELWAQGPAPGSRRPPPETGGFTLKVDVNMVVVEATVRDGKGRIADDLKGENFRVFEDGKNLYISHVTSCLWPWHGWWTAAAAYRRCSVNCTAPPTTPSRSSNQRIKSPCMPSPCTPSAW